MDLERIIEVLEISLPVFAMIGLGKILSIRGFITEDRKSFINEFVNSFSLPSLIFINVAMQNFKGMWNPALILPSFIGIVILLAVFMTLVKLLGYKGGFAAAWVFGTFWANISYVGFPMSEMAFGHIGINLAAVYNAYFMLVYIPFAFILIGIYAGGEDDMTILQRVINIFKTPILLAAIFGTLVSYIGDSFRVEQMAEEGSAAQAVMLPAAVKGGLRVIESFLRLVGSMGLPMALVAIGASMNMKALTDRFFALCMVIAGKLLLLPGLTLLFTLYFFPDAPKEVLGIGVLLASMPDAVASYVIAKQVGVEEGFVSSMLVLSTAISIITIPFWLYIII